VDWLTSDDVPEMFVIVLLVNNSSDRSVRIVANSDTKHYSLACKLGYIDSSSDSSRDSKRGIPYSLLSRVDGRLEYGVSFPPLRSLLLIITHLKSSSVHMHHFIGSVPEYIKRMGCCFCFCSERCDNFSLNFIIPGLAF
jgi:hypothetical protein